MRSKVLGLAAAAVAAGALTLVPSAPSHAAAWKPVSEIPFPAGTVTDIEVVSTGDGDAVAGAIIDGSVYAATAVDGVWTGQAKVRGKFGDGATDLVLASNGKGDNAIGWVEDVSGDLRLRVSRQSSPNLWSGHLLGPMTPVGTDVVGKPQVEVTGSGRVITAAAVDGGDSNHELVVTEWAKGGGSPNAPQTLAASDAWNPSLDVNSKGEALLAYTYSGLIDDVMIVSRRSAGGTWSLGDSTSNSGDIAAPADVAISENGQGQVIYGVAKANGFLAETSLVLANGTALDGKVLSNTAEYVSWPTVAIDDDGSALFAWIAVKDGSTYVRHASAEANADPGAPQTLTGTQPSANLPIARVDGPFRLVQTFGDGKITTHYRTSPVQSFSPTTTGTGYYHDHALDIDGHGNAVMLGVQSGVFQARFLDAGGPSLSLTRPGSATTVSTAVPLEWTAPSDSLSTLQPGTDLYVSSSRWNQPAFSTPAVIVDNAPGTTASYTATPGATYCFQARAVDTAGNGTTTAKRCTTVPLDDVSLAGSGWTRAAKSGQFKGTWTTTTTKGRTLSRSGISAKSLALVANRVSNGGLVEVRWNGTLLKKISLKGAAATKKVYPIVSWAGLHTGTLTIKVISPTGRPVRIDGLAVAK